MRDEETHESYALISFSRVTGGLGPLYGTPIEARSGVRLMITESSRVFNGVSGERFVDGKIILEAMLSEMQFAELITTMNVGMGTPMTLDLVREGAMKQCEKPPPQESEAKRIKEAFEAQVAAKTATLKSVRRRIRKLLAESKISEKRKEQIDNEIFQFTRLFEDSAPFMMKQFERSTVEAVADAKASISSHARAVAEATGLRYLAEGDRPKEIDG
jgi:hypothetical protein